MPHKAFLKKKSLLDRFKDDYGGFTVYIQSARAARTWNNPLTRHKRTNKLQGWVKSFAGKNHIHKLARFNAQQAGRYESYEDVKLDCMRYADILELQNGVCVKVNATIRCPRRAAFVFRITGIYDAEPENPSKYVIRGFYPVYGLERKPSEEFDIPCNDVSDIEQWVKSNEKGTRMQNEAMSLKGFIENLTEKLTKQFDLDENEVKNYLDSHTEEMQILLDDKDMSLKEKVLFVRSEITGEKDESKKSERLFNKRELERIALSEGSKVSPYLVEIAHKILKDEYGWKASTLEEVAYWLGDHKQAFEHAYGQALRSSDDDKANVKAGIEAALDEEEQGVMDAEIAMMGESKKHEGFNTTRDLDNFALHILNYIKDKTHYPGYVRFVKLNDDEEDFYGKYFLSVNGKTYYLYVDDTDYAITDNNDENILVEGSTDLSGAIQKDLNDFCKRITQPFYTESKEPADEKLSYEKGHKNSKGEDAPWVIRSHEDNRVLASFATKKAAEEHMQRMKQYSKTESRADGERDVDDYDTMRDGLEALGFELDSDVRNGKIYPYRRVSKATKNGITYTFMIDSDNDYTKSITVFGGKFNRNDPNDPDGTRFSSVKDVLDAMKTIEEAKKSESSSSGIEKVFKDAAEACGVADKVTISTDGDMVYCVMEMDVDKYGLDHYKWSFDTKTNELGWHGDESTKGLGARKKFDDMDELKSWIIGDIEALFEMREPSKRGEGFSLELIDTIRVPAWLWKAYLFNDTNDLEPDEIETFEKFKETYKYNHLDDREEEPYFSSHNDFDSLGGDVYDVDVYKRSDMPTEKKSEAVKDFPNGNRYKFNFNFYNPKTANIAEQAAKDKGIACTKEQTIITIAVAEPQDAIRFADAVVNLAQSDGENMTDRHDIDKAFNIAVKKDADYEANKDAIDAALTDYVVDLTPSPRHNLLYVLGELTDVVDFLEAIK